MLVFIIYAFLIGDIAKKYFSKHLIDLANYED